MTKLTVYIDCRFTGTETKYLNLGSYNYLGFAQADGICSKHSVEAIDKYGCATTSTRKEIGNFEKKKKLAIHFYKIHVIFFLILFLFRYMYSS